MKAKDGIEENVRQEDLGELTLYRYIQPEGSGEAEIMAVEFEGPGLWGPIKGFLALGADAETIRGLTFYEQEETPGLGGEIASESFRRQFEGKKSIRRSMSHCIPFTGLIAFPLIYQPAFW